MDMSTTVANTRPDAPVVTLVGQLQDGGYVAEAMEETSVPYGPYWEDAIDQVMVYLDPNDAQLKEIVAALNDGRLDYSSLRDYGSSNGGISMLPI
jgi:hypothetical protein